jgi:putative Mg2+ transporter-C (MgtC) family protein
MLPTELELVLIARLLLAATLAGFVGFERSVSQKRAGFRTHILVGLGAAAFTEASIYGFGPALNEPSRLAANIVVGIGFLGAGTIFRSGDTIFGLTTAASLWVVAAIGLLAGQGLGWLAVACTVLVWIVLRFLTTVEDWELPKVARWVLGQPERERGEDPSRQVADSQETD